MEELLTEEVDWEQLAADLIRIETQTPPIFNRSNEREYFNAKYRTRHDRNRDYDVWRKIDSKLNEYG